MKTAADGFDTKPRTMAAFCGCPVFHIKQNKGPDDDHQDDYISPFSFDQFHSSKNYYLESTEFVYSLHWFCPLYHCVMVYFRF